MGRQLNDGFACALVDERQGQGAAGAAIDAADALGQRRVRGKEAAQAARVFGGGPLAVVGHQKEVGGAAEPQQRAGQGALGGGFLLLGEDFVSGHP